MAALTVSHTSNIPENGMGNYFGLHFMLESPAVWRKRPTPARLRPGPGEILRTTVARDLPEQFRRTLRAQILGETWRASDF